MAGASVAEVRRQELLQSLLTSEASDFPWLDRRIAREVLVHSGLPYPGKGRWQYSDLATVINASLTFQQAEDAIAKTDSADAVSLTDEKLKHSLISLGTSETEDGFQLVDVNSLLFRSGSRIQTRQQTEASVVLENTSETVDRHFITVNPHSTLTLTETFETGNRVLMCRVRDHATLHYELDMPSAEGIGYHGVVVWLGEGAAMNLHLATNGSALRRNEIVVNFVGRDATANLKGGWQLAGREHLDSLICMRHRVGSGRSEQTFNGVVDEQSRSAFTGLIHIERDAAATEAHLSNRNVSISQDARAIALPELEIYTDDVVCSHGATTGQLDEDALFLLRARGLSAMTARRLLIKAFLRQVVTEPRGKTLLNL